MIRLAFANFVDNSRVDNSRVDNSRLVLLKNGIEGQIFGIQRPIIIGRTKRCLKYTVVKVKCEFLVRSDIFHHRTIFLFMACKRLTNFLYRVIGTHLYDTQESRKDPVLDFEWYTNTFNLSKELQS